MLFTRPLKKGMVSDWIFAIVETQQVHDRFSFLPKEFHSIPVAGD
jgi:hypothetical protein